LRTRSEREDRLREDIARVAVDKSGGELVRYHPTCVDVRDLERGAEQPDDWHGHSPRQFYEDEKYRQQIDEPQGSERVDERQEKQARDFDRALLVNHSGRLDRELDRHPEQVKICEVQDLAVDILPPRPINDVGEKKPGNEEEVRHAKRQREGDNGVQPALMSNDGPDAERRMHHHDEDDAKTLGVVDPVDSPVMDLSAVHDMRATRRRIGFNLAKLKCDCGSRVSISALLWRRHRL
jgi:hypothetical protein